MKPYAVSNVDSERWTFGPINSTNATTLRSLLTLALVKFAIRTTIRNHSTLKRDGVIKQVADAVGPSHTVDLKNYDALILVEIYKVRDPSSLHHYVDSPTNEEPQS